jgi:hypothetical protein
VVVEEPFETGDSRQAAEVAEGLWVDMGIAVLAFPVASDNREQQTGAGGNDECGRAMAYPAWEQARDVVSSPCRPTHPG